MKEDGAYCFRLLCMLFPKGIPSGVRFVPWKSLMVFTRSFEGDWRYLCENGHEHISLMPFLLYNFPWEACGDEMTDKKSDKILLLGSRVFSL